MVSPSLCASLRRLLAKFADNRVLAPRGFFARDFSGNGRECLYLPPDEYDRLAGDAAKPNPRVPGETMFSVGPLGIPVYRLPEHMDKRDCWNDWREGRRG